MKSLRSVGKQVIRAFTRHETNYSVQLNTPVKFRNSDWFANERIVEIPFVHSQLGYNPPGKRILEFGCTGSLLALQLASLGYQVVGVDLRPYPFTHPNLTTYQDDILDLDLESGFDYITAISVLEHVGLGAYGEGDDEAKLDRVVTKLVTLLAVGGMLIVTVPFGQVYRDSFFRSFSNEQIIRFFHREGMLLVSEQFFRRWSFKFWSHASREDVEEVSNAAQDRGPTGVNAIGCFIWKRETG